ncbi:MAG: hypothetical protein R2823_05740 [Acidimicrobiia bacterium]
MRITGDSATTPVIVDELTRSSPPTETKSWIDFDISDGIPKERPVVALAGSRLALKHGVGLHSNGVLRLHYGIKWAGTVYAVDLPAVPSSTSPMSVHIYLPRHLDRWSGATSGLLKVGSRDGSTLIQVAAKNVIYEIIDSLLAYQLLHNRSAMLHAAALCKGDRTAVLAGTGGVGKSTSLLAAMSRRQDLRYLGDDLIVIDENGRAFRHPKKVQVYDYNLDRLPETKTRLLDRLGPARRGLWTVRASWLGPKQVRMRVSAEDLFGAAQVADESQIDTVFWVVPGAVERVTSRPMDPGEAAQHAAAALVDEFWDFARLLNLGSVLTDRAMSLDAFYSDTLGVYRSAFSRGECYQLSVPRDAEPVEIVDSLSSLAGW